MDSYVDLEYADNYFESRLHSGLWANSLAGDRNAALLQATQAIDRLRFVGSRTDIDQELEFPRGGDDTVPSDIKIACCEIAFNLLDGKDPDAEFEDLSVTSRGFSSVRSANDRSFIQEHTNAGIPSSRAWRYIRPYLLDDRNITLRRVN